VRGEKVGSGEPENGRRKSGGGTRKRGRVSNWFGGGEMGEKKETLSKGKNQTGRWSLKERSN